MSYSIAVSFSGEYSMLKFAKIQISYPLLIISVSLILFEANAFPHILVILSAALVHELGHIFIAYILKIQIKSIKLDIFGALIETDLSGCSYGKEAIFSLAGPLFNILSALFAYICLPLGYSTKLFILSSSLFAFINLLPAKDFDGGRVLSSVLLRFSSPQSVCSIVKVTSFLSIFLLWSISVYFIMKTGAYLSLFIFSLILFSKMFLSINY